MTDLPGRELEIGNKYKYIKCWEKFSKSDSIPGNRNTSWPRPECQLVSLSTLAAESADKHQHFLLLFLDFQHQLLDFHLLRDHFNFNIFQQYVC